MLTMNNLACWHRKHGDTDAALGCLRAAAKIGTAKSVGDANPQHLAVTHSNLGAILSQRGQHDRARQHTQLAVPDLGPRGGRDVQGHYIDTARKTPFNGS